MYWKTKPILFLLSLVIVISCGKEEVLPPDNLIGEWNVYSISNNTDPVIIWDELKASAVDLIPAYSCMEFTTSATEQIVTTRYVFIDENQILQDAETLLFLPTLGILIQRLDSIILYKEII